MKRSKPHPVPSASGAGILKTTMRDMAATAACCVAVLGILMLIATLPAGIAEPIKKLTRMP